MQRRTVISPQQFNLLGKVRFAPPHTTQTWYHGSTAKNVSNIVKSQELFGSGDFGDGGYLVSDPSWAAEYAHEASDGYGKPGVAKASVQPKKPFYGRTDSDKQTWQTLDMLRNNGHDVWFPMGRNSRTPGPYAVLLDDNAGRAARFSKGSMDDVAHRDLDETPSGAGTVTVPKKTKTNVRS